MDTHMNLDIYFLKDSKFQDDSDMVVVCIISTARRERSKGSVLLRN